MQNEIMNNEKRGIKLKPLVPKNVKVVIKVIKNTTKSKTDPIMLKVTCDFREEYFLL